MNARSAGVTAKRIAAVARIYHLLRQLDEDARHKDRGGKIVYVVDNDIVSRYADPEDNTSIRYMRLFEARDEEEKDIGRINLLKATSRLTMDEFFSPHNRQNIVFPPAYRRQFIETLRHFARDGAERALADATSPKKLGKLADRVRAALGGDNEAEALYLLRTEAPYLLLSVIPGETPLDRLNGLLDDLLGSSSRFPDLGELPPRDGAWKKIFEAIFEHRRESRKESLKSGRISRELLEQNVVEDVDAIMQTVNLNMNYSNNNTKFVFLTGDRGIHRCADDIYLRKKLSVDGWPNFNFIRRPAQLTRFMQNDCLRYSSETSTNSDFIESIARFLSLTYSDGRKLYSLIHEPPRDEDLYFYSDDRPLGRVLSHYLQQMEQDILESRQAALVLQAAAIRKKTSNLQKLFESLHKRIDGKEEWIDTLLKKGLSLHLSRVRALLEIPSSGRDLEALNDLLLLLVSTNRSDEADAHADARLWRRLPTYPKFPNAVQTVFASIVASSVDGERGENVRSLHGIDPCWLFLFNAYLAALQADWEMAERHAGLAADYAKHTALDEQAEAECLYFRAVCRRHRIKPGAETLIKGQEDIETALKLKREPRYLAEKAAYGLAIPYHQLFYGEYDAAVDKAPTADETLTMLVEAERIFTESGGFEAGEPACQRFRTQLYSNFCNVYLHAEVLNPKGFPLVARPDSNEVERWLKALTEAVADRGGEERVSYFVRFVKWATEILLLLEEMKDGERPVNLSALLEKVANLVATGGASVGKEIIPYDRKKIDDFLDAVRRRLDRSAAPAG